MKRIVFAFTVALASVAWGQQPQQSCLVVSGKHHDRIDSVGRVQFRSRYSDKQLRKLSDAGVHIVTLPKRRGDSVPDITALCRVEPVEDLASVIRHAAPVASLQPLRKCLEMMTDFRGESSCILWSDDERLNRK